MAYNPGPPMGYAPTTMPASGPMPAGGPMPPYAQGPPSMGSLPGGPAGAMHPPPPYNPGTMGPVPPILPTIGSELTPPVGPGFEQVVEVITYNDGPAMGGAIGGVVPVPIPVEVPDYNEQIVASFQLDRSSSTCGYPFCCPGVFQP